MGEARCCCCIPIRAGVITLAILRLIWGGSTIILGIVGSSEDPEANPTVIKLLEKNATSETVDAYISFIKPVAVYDIINGIFIVMMGTLVLKGTSERNVGHFKLWVKISYVMLVTSAVGIVSIPVAYMTVVPQAGITIPVANLLLGAISLAISGYNIRVVKNYSSIMVQELEIVTVKGNA